MKSEPALHEYRLVRLDGSVFDEKREIARLAAEVARLRAVIAASHATIGDEYGHAECNCEHCAQHRKDTTT